MIMTTVQAEIARAVEAIHQVMFAPYPSAQCTDCGSQLWRGEFGRWVNAQGEDSCTWDPAVRYLAHDAELVSH
jgi:hypothetical protein